MWKINLRWVCFATVLFLNGVWAGAQANIVLRSTPLGPMPADINQTSITPDGQHIAVAADSGSRRDVFIDGNVGEVYSALLQMPSIGKGAAPRLLMISPDATRYAYAATKRPGESVMVINQKEGPVFDSIISGLFSPVGHRLAYVAMKANKNFVVLDSTVSAPYRQVSLAGFSGDGKHFGFIAMSGEKTDAWHAVVDGKESPGYSSVSKMILSSTGRVAYEANIGSDLTPLERQQHANDALFGNHMVLDGQVGPSYSMIQSATFSDDGSHFAYTATASARSPLKWVAVIDGQAGPEFDQISNVVFSPDGKHSAYTGTDSQDAQYAAYAVVDGKKSLDYRSCGGFIFSPDSQHLAYVANDKVVVLDGKEGDARDGTNLTPTCFSPDSKRLAYIASAPGGKMSLVLDGKMGPPLPSIDPRSIQFTADSQHCRFKVGMSADASFFDMDNQALDPAAPALDLVATADGRHTAIVAAKDVGTGVQTCRVMLDGKPIGEAYQGIQHLQISADGAHVAYLGLTNGSEKKSAHAVYDGHEGPAYFRIDKLLLSPDGQHFAYACTDDGAKHYVVVDSFQGPEYNDVFLGVTGQYEGMQFTADGSLSFLPVKDGKLSHVIMTADAIAAIPKPAAGAGSGAPAAAAPAGYSKVYTFGGVPKDGSLPAVLTAAPDGTLYGGTNGGGKYQIGVLFKCAPDGSGYAIMHSFAGGQTDGMRPTSIFVGPDGAVYGSLLVQGPSGSGCIFRCTPDGADYKILHAFSGSEGGAPVIQAIEPDGTLCGVSGNPGQALLRMKPDGSDPTVIFDSNKAPGGANKNPLGRFTDGGDGFYYGAAGQTLFKIKKDGTGYAVLHKFVGAPTDGRYADSAPILGGDGKLYGFDKDGGQARGGTIFSLARDGSGYQLIVDPDPGPDQLNPSALVEGGDGKLYAFVRAGLARCNKDGSGYEIVQANPGGGFPWTALVHGGAVYGACDQGPNRGTLFRFGTGGATAGGSGTPTGPTAVVQTLPPEPLDGNVDLPK